jgi:hypothetical protein
VGIKAKTVILKRWIMSCFPLGLIIYGFLVKKKTNKGTLVERQESKNYDLV